ncbi:MAG TPA: hypothetical protein VM553_22730 [Dongiaceae bacterium]|nr:hypothetical protein [Dongiaceae bacterium]
MFKLIQQGQTIARRLYNNRIHIREDLTLALQHAWTLPYLTSPWSAESLTRSELHPLSYNNWGDVINLSLQAMVPLERRTYSPGTLACYPEHYAVGAPREKWFFINGICTSPPVAILNGLELAKAFHRPIHLIHTPTSGVLWDLWDSMTARTLRKDGLLGRLAYDVVKEALRHHDKVVIVGHSQGTIVASYIARKLLKDKRYRHHAPKLEIYCIAGVADSFRVDPDLSAHFGRGVPYVEHFANGLDFFCRIGVLAHLDNTSGAVFVLPNRTGHLLNDHYIPGIWRGEYCNKRSRLYKYIDGNTPASNDYVQHNLNMDDDSADDEAANDDHAEAS